MMVERLARFPAISLKYNRQDCERHDDRGVPEWSYEPWFRELDLRAVLHCMSGQNVARSTIAGKNRHNFRP
jgi:hypothetical protein